MNTRVFKIDNQPNRDVILLQVDGDTSFYPGNATLLSGVSIVSGSGTVGPDMIAIEALTGTNDIYYRSAANTWTSVSFGSALSFTGGILGTDADLTAIAALTGSGTIYYRSSTNTWSPITIGNGISFVGGTLSTGAFDGDLNALANLTGSNTLYYRSGTDTWLPVVIGTNLTFSAGTLSAASGSGTLGGDLTAIEALTGTNTIYYRSATDTWTAVTVTSGLVFAGGILYSSGVDPSGLGGVVPLNKGGTAATTASGARSNLGLGTLSTQDATGVNILGGTISGTSLNNITISGITIISGLPVAQGGTSATTASGARSNLGLVIGTDVQAYDGDLLSLASLTGSGTIYYRSASNTWSPVTIVGGLSFISGTLSGSITGGLGSDLTALEALTGTNTLYYRQSDGVWQPILPTSNKSSYLTTLIRQDISSTSGYLITQGLYDQNTNDFLFVSNNLLYKSDIDTANPSNFTLNIMNGGTSASTAAGARTNLGLAIGTNVQAYDADLSALAALTGVNEIYYRAGANTWSEVQIGSGLIFNSGLLTSIDNFYDAEADIGLIAESTNNGTKWPLDTGISLANTTKLNSALSGMWAGGAFTFANGTVGPVLKPIRFSAKEFFFQGPIRFTPVSGVNKIGQALYGFGSRPYSMTEVAYAANSQGGATTRLTRIDGQNGGPVIIIGSAGATIQGMEIKGMRYAGTSGIDASGTKCQACIAIEGRGSDISSGKVTLRDLNLDFATYGIYCPPGYYSGTGTTIVTNQSHADESVAQNIYCSHIGSFFRSENEQAVGWSFRDIYLLGSSVAYPLTGFDYYRAGNMCADNVILNAMSCVVLRIHETSANTNSYTIKNIVWDNFEYLNDPTGVFCTLFKHTQTDANGAPYGAAVRIDGHFANNPNYYNHNKLIEFESAFGTTTPMSNFDDILFDIKNLPNIISGANAFPTLGDGPWRYPSQDYWGPYQKKPWVIEGGAITASEPYLKVDTESGAASDDLDVINGGTAGKTLTLRAANANRSVVVKNAIPNTSGLVSYWKLDEGSSTRYDSHSTNHLTPVGTHVPTGGKIFRGARFLEGVSNYMSGAAGLAELQVGDIDFTLSCWVKALTKPHSFTILSKYTASLLEYDLYWDSGSDRIKFAVSPTGSWSSPPQITGSTFGSLPSGAWTHIVAGHDATNNQLFMYINGVAETGVSYSSGVYAGNAAFHLIESAFGSSELNGVIDEVGFWKRRLTATEITQLYNGGTGQSYPFAIIASGRPGNLRLGSDYTLDSEDDVLQLKYDGNTWFETYRKNAEPSNIKTMEFPLFGLNDSVTTGNGKGYFIVPPSLSGGNVTFAHAYVGIAGSGASTDLMITRTRSASTVNVLSTGLKIDTLENGTETSSVPYGISTSSRDLLPYDIIKINVTGVNTVPPTGLLVTLEITI